MENKETPKESLFQGMLDRIRAKAAQHPVTVPQPKKPGDGIECSRCQNSGWVEVIEDGHRCMTLCPDCAAKRQVVRRLKCSGVSPKDYARYTLESFDGSRSESARRMKALAIAYLKNHVPGGPGFGIFGKSGMGKTHICIAVCHELTVRLHEPHYYFSYRSEMPNLVKAAKSYAADYDEAMEKWKTCPNLYMDDLFKLAGKIQNGHLVDVDREELRIVFDIINARYLNHRTTIFSSEYSVNDIAVVDEALGSRIYEMVAPYGLYITGVNQRLAGTR